MEDFSYKTAYYQGAMNINGFSKNKKKKKKKEVAAIIETRSQNSKWLTYNLAPSKKEYEHWNLTR